MQHGDRKLHSGQLRGWVVGSETRREGGEEGRKQKKKEEGEEDHAQREGSPVLSYSCWCKREEKKPPLHLFSLSVSAEENNSAAPGKRGEDRGILGVPQKPGGSHSDEGSSRPQQLLRLLLSINAFHPLRNPAYLSTKLETILCKISFTTANLLLYSYLAGKKDMVSTHA